MARISRTLTVVRRHSLTPNMLRLTLGGQNLAGFPEGQESGYIKLMFPHEGGAGIASGLKAVLTRSKPRQRSYTIRAYDASRLELDVDFATHGDNGPASAWAINVKEGDSITISGPGPTKLMEQTADWFFIAGDMSALPAISVNLEKLPDNARGYAVIEVIESSDITALKTPAGIEVHWVVNPHPEKPNDLLANKVTSLPWLDGRPNVWVACEFNAMRSMRRYFKLERDVAKKEIYASSYWKIGSTDEGNKAAKLLDIGP